MCIVGRNKVHDCVYQFRSANLNLSKNTTFKDIKNTRYKLVNDDNTDISTTDSKRLAEKKKQL